MAITRFHGAHAHLSNFAPTPIAHPDGITYPTAEHAFQAQKTEDMDERRAIAAQPTPGKAKRAGRKVQLRPDWEEIKRTQMAQIIAIKFAPGTEMAAKLEATGDQELIEGNTWNDTYWGVNAKTGKGRNELGRILMDQRDRNRW